MKIHTAPDAVLTYLRKPTRVPLHFREEICVGIFADVKRGFWRKCLGGWLIPGVPEW
jgi:hypothetical protein